MRTNNLSLVFLLTCGLATALSAEPGDLAPRSTMAYGKVAHVANAAKKLGGDDWIKPIERMFGTLRKRDREQVDPGVKEARRFMPFAGMLEVALCDIMVREPHVQMVVALHLDEGAPAEFSEEFRAFMKEEGPKKAKIEAAEISDEQFVLRLRPGLLVLTIGGTARNHVDDVFASKYEESLSQVERFKKWAERASADIEVWASVKAIREAIDKGGEDMRMDSDMQVFLDAVEWQKWDTFTASLSLPGKTGGLALNADLTFNPALDSVTALLRPAGASRLMRTLPAETLGFLSFQLGNDADKTITDLMKYFHDIDQRNQPARLKRRLGWEKDSLRHMEQQLKALEGKGGEADKDKDGVDAAQPGIPGPSRLKEPIPEPGKDEKPQSREEQIKELKDQIQRQKAEIAEMEKELAALTSRPFTADPEARRGNPTGPERLHDNIHEMLKAVGIERTEVTACIGNELLAGVIALPDPEEDSLNDMFSHLWFANLELREGHETLKDKIVNFALGKALPDGATEEQKAEAAKRAEQMMFKKVDGGEILTERGLMSNAYIYFGDTFMGIAGSEEAARRVLAASMGANRFSPGNVPGTAGGSKFFYADFAEFFARLEANEYRWSRQSRNFDAPYADIRRLLKSGLRLSAATNESATRISLSAQTAGENSLAPLMERMASELENERAWRHDTRELGELGTAINRWVDRELRSETGKAMADEDREKLVKGLTAEKLVEAGDLKPRDGLRSAFDPAMAARFKAMLEKGEEVLGGEGGPGNVAESGFEWYGLPMDWADRDRVERYGNEPAKMWMLCASKGAWARGGRVALVFTGSMPRTMWLNEAEFKQLRSANGNGSRLEAFAKPARELPRWKVRAQLQQQRWQLQSLQQLVQRARERETAAGRDFEVIFNGATAGENAMEKLIKALGATDEDHVYIDDITALEIEGKGETFRVRLKVGTHWVEMDEKGTIKTSLGEE